MSTSEEIPKTPDATSTTTDASAEAATTTTTTAAEPTKKDTRTWPQKSPVDGAGNVVTNAIDAMSNFFIGVFQGKEAAAADRQRTQELKQGRKEWQAEQPRFKGSVAQRVTAKKEQQAAEAAQGKK